MTEKKNPIAGPVATSYNNMNGSYDTLFVVLFTEKINPQKTLLINRCTAHCCRIFSGIHFFATPLTSATTHT